MCGAIQNYSHHLTALKLLYKFGFDIGMKFNGGNDQKSDASSAIFDYIDNYKINLRKILDDFSCAIDCQF
jgi:hypothetical protein